MGKYYSRDGKKQDSWGEWIPIVIMLMIPSGWTKLIGLIWLVSKLTGGTRRKSANVKRHPYDLQRERADQADWEDRREDGRPAAAQAAARVTADRVDAKKAKGKAKGAAAKTRERERKAVREGGGAGLIVGGAITSAIFSMGAISIVEDLIWCIANGYSFTGELTGLVACLMFLGGGLAMLFSGLDKRRRGERYLNYLAYIGANREVDLARMAASMDVSAKRLVKDLRRMLAKGILPTGYIDLAEGKLFLTEMGYQAPEPKPAPEPEKEVSPEKEKEKEDAILREIRQVNDDIPDESMSAKIDRIEEITGKILAYQKKHPNRAGQLRSFLNYYLPTTLKILRAYAQLDAQGIEGENISAAKARIEGMMDQVVAGFEKQLDRLFQDDALDIAADVEVLENMLKSDGLSGGEGMTLGL